MQYLALILIALKIAGVGNFSWAIPIGLLIVWVIINVIIHHATDSHIGSDWHDKMFD